MSVYGNFINESYFTSLDQFLSLNIEIESVVNYVDEEYNNFSNLISIDEKIDLKNIDFEGILNKISDLIIELVYRFRNFLEASIDKTKSIYTSLLTNLDKNASIKHSINISDYNKIEDVNSDLEKYFNKAEDGERKLQINQNDEDFISDVNDITDDLKNVKFDYSIIKDDNDIKAEKYFSSNEIMNNIKKVFNIVISSKKLVLSKLPAVETMAKQSKRTLKKDKNEFNLKGNQCAVRFFNSLLTFLNKALSFYRALDNKLFSDIKNIHKSSHDPVYKSIANYLDLFKKWKTITGKFPKSIKTSKEIKSKEEYEQLEKDYKIIYKSDDYEEYKKSFASIASYFGLHAKEIIIRNLEIKPNDKFGVVNIWYAKGLARVQLPKGTHLIHSTPEDLDGYIIGAFRSRNNGRYFYPERRAFFSVEKQVSATKNGTEGMKMDKYVTVDSYDHAYLDPSCPGFGDRYVMLITDDKIPVKKASIEDAISRKSSNDEDNDKIIDFDNTKDKLKAAANESVEELIEGGFDVDDILDNIVNEENLEILGEEGLKTTINMINNWNTANKKQRVKKYYNDKISEEEYEMLKDTITKFREAKSYNDYKPYFVKFCKFCSILPEHVIITKYRLHKKNENNNSLYVEYSNNNKKIPLPEGTKLFHISKVPGINALKPSFQGKSERGYLYDKPRIYFTIFKNMPRFLADYKATDKLYKYQATVNIKEVFVDPLVWLFAQGAVYIETNNEVPVKQVSFDTKNIIKDITTNLKNHIV